MTLGNGTVETADYNAHLQLTDLKLGLSAGASDRWRFENGYAAAGNNGNVLSQTVTVLNAAPTTTQYGYDGLNRLKLANEEPTSTSNPVCPDAGSHWCQQYAYDARGNRRVEAESHLALAIGRPDAFGTDNWCQVLHRLGVVSLGAVAGRGPGSRRARHWRGIRSGGYGGILTGARG